MTISVRERILEAVVAQLSASPGYYVDRNRLTETPPSKMPALIVIDGGQTASDETYGITKYVLRLTVLCAVTGTYAQLGPSINAAYADVLKRLLQDRTLGGLSVDLREDEAGLSDPEFEANPARATAAVNFLIDFFTKPGQPDLVGP